MPPQLETLTPPATVYADAGEQLQAKDAGKPKPAKVVRTVGVLEAGRISEDLSGKHGSYLEMYSAFLGGYGLKFIGYDVASGVFPSSPNACDAWLVSGSVSSANDPDPWIGRLCAFVRAAYARGSKLVGVCFGHQVIALALGGRVEQADAYAAGVRDYIFDHTVTPLVASHGDQVVAVPPGASVVGHAPYCPYAALRYGNRAFSVQPHPEFTPAFMDDLLVKLKVPPEKEVSKSRLRPDRVAEYIMNFLHA